MTQTTARSAPPHPIDRLNNRMNITLLPGQRHRRGLVMRRSVFNRQQARRRKVSTGITASIANLTESAGTSEATGTGGNTSWSSH
jgi:hypothetical protein